MTDTPPPSGPDALPQPRVEPPQRRRRAVSAVWLVPIVAIIIALGIAWQSYANRGVLVAIAFPDASGVEIGNTTLRFREVVVGVVEDVGFSPDLTQVNVYVRVSRNVAPYLDESASFWVVQPEVTTRGVEGLSTILSGTYIEGTWDSEIGEARTAFVGDERAPIVPPGVDGTAIVLSSRESSRLGPGAPILYRGIEVGEVAQPRLSPDGSGIIVDAFVRAPYDRQLSTATRFWDASGVSFGVGASGVELRIGSVATLVEGGLNFDTLISGGTEIGEGHVYNIFADEAAARASTFEAPAARSVQISALFPSAQQGLSAGSAVRYAGSRVGVVTSITGFIRPDDPTQSVQLLATMSIQPVKMGLDGMANELDGIDYVTDLVTAGLRARMASTGLLGGERIVELVEVENATPARVEIGVTDTPLIPSVDPEEAGGLAESASGVLDRLAALPIEELLTSATDLLQNVNRIAGSEETRAIPGAALAAIEDGRGLLQDGRDVLSAPEIARVLASVEAATTDVAALSRALVEQDTALRLTETIGAAGAASENIARATEELDALVVELTEVAGQARAILADEAIQAIPGAALATLEGGRDLLAAPEIDSILADVEALATDLSGLSAELTEAGVAARVTATLDSASVAAGNIARGTADLDAVANSVARAADGAAAILDDEATQAIPGAALAVLEDGRGLVSAGRELLASPQIGAVLTDVETLTDDLAALSTELREAGIGTQVTATLDAAAVAADNVARGTADLDAVAASVGRAADGAAAILADEATQALPGAALGALQEGQALIADGRAVLAEGQLTAILENAASAAAGIDAIVSELAAASIAPQVTEAVVAATDAARNLAEGTVGLDAIAAGIDRAVASADAILSSAETRALPGAALGLIEDGRAVVASPELQTLIVELSDTATEVRAIAAQLAAEEAAVRLTETLTAAAEAARSVASGTESLPALSASAERVLAQAEELGAGLNRLTLKAEGLALEELVSATTELMETADAFLSSDEAGDVPVVLSNMLEEVRLTVETIRTGGTIDNLNATLDSAAGAADAVAGASRDLPALVARLSSLTGQAGTLLESYSDGSRVNQELFAALRAATRAAEDVSSLSRTIERNPNSLLLGR